MIDEKSVAEEVVEDVHRTAIKLMSIRPAIDLVVRLLDLEKDIQNFAQQLPNVASISHIQEPANCQCSGHKFVSGKQMAKALSCLVNERASALQRRISSILSKGNSTILYSFSIERDGWTKEQISRVGRGGGPKPGLARYVGEGPCPLCDPNVNAQVTNAKAPMPRRKHNKRFDGPKPIQAFDKSHRRIGSWASVTEAARALKGNRCWVGWFETNKPGIDLDSTTIRVGIGKAATANQMQATNGNVTHKPYGPYIWVWK